jgi:filamentous hemagglutinin family protein
MGVWAIAPLDTTASAQITPDETLASERSQITPDQVIQGVVSDQIDGGAIRGINLFHSFEQFNVNEGRGAYFSNPAGIENILSRVTGNDPSDILGTLGVLGNANLFLLNPNGILFGPNASLDVAGSFTATTADAIALGEQGFFSASQPQQSSLLSVPPSVFFFNQVISHGGTINNAGNLATGQDLTLTANNLELQGQLQAGRDLTLQAQDTVRIRDSVTNPFVAVAGRQLLVQGNQTVDIFALNHPNSGLFSGGNMVLRSANQIGGDAHYWSGGSFRIEQLDGNLGDLHSPYDPIIRSLGDVSFNNYFGASLHILAAGSVNIGTAIITNPEAGTIGTDFVQETVQLSDGTEIAIDGSAQPTLDIRAGMNPAQISTPTITGINGDEFFDNDFFLETPILTDIPTNANITIGDVVVRPSNGLVFLTNQYEPNPSLIGDITITGNGLFGVGIDASSVEGNGSSVIVNSRGNIVLAEVGLITSSANPGIAGDISLIAANDILLAPLAEITANGGDGDIQIQGNRLIMQEFSGVSSLTEDTDNSGNILIQTTDAVQINGGNIGTFGLSQASGNSGNITIKTGELTSIGVSLFGGLFTGGDITTDTAGAGNAGDITIDARQVRLIDGAQIRASTLRLGDIGGTGNAGEITIRASDFVEVDGISLEGNQPSKIATTVNPGATGSGGNLLIETNRLIVSNDAQIQAGVFGAGQGGSLTINATQSVDIFDTVIDDNPTGLFAGPEGSAASGTGGDITVRTGQLNIQGGESEISSEVDLEASGNAGDILIETNRLVAGDGAGVSASTFGTGQSGTLTINASESIDLFGVDTTVEDGDPSRLFTITLGIGDAGDLMVRTGRLSIRDGAAISASTLGLIGDGRSGNVTIEALESIEVTGRSTDGQLFSSIDAAAGAVVGFVNPSATAIGGNLSITTGQLIVRDGAEISTETFGAGDAGDLTINASELVQLSDSDLSTRTTGSGNAGNLSITTRRLLIQGSAEAVASTREGQGQGGNLVVTASDSVELVGRAGLGTLSLLGGDAGDLTIQTGRLVLRDGAGISTGSLGTGQAGDLNIIAADSVEVIGGGFYKGSEISDLIGDLISTPSDIFDPNEQVFLPSRISADAINRNNNPAGDLTIQTGRLIVRDGAEVTTGTLGESSGGTLTVNAAERVEVSGVSPDGDPSRLSAQTIGAGDAGDIIITSGQVNVRDGAEISASASVTTAGSSTSDTGLSGRPGSILIQNADSVTLSNNGSISTAVEAGAIVSNETDQGGNIEIQTQQLSITDDAEITASTSGRGDAGSITVRDAEVVTLSRGFISTAVNAGAVGAGGNIEIQSRILSLSNDAEISASTAGQGNAGDIAVRGAETVSLANGSISTAVNEGAIGQGGNIAIRAGSLELSDRSQISSSTAGQGNTGQITIDATDAISLTDRSRITSEVQSGATGNSRQISLQTPILALQENSRISAATDGRGSAGNILIQDADSVSLDNSTISTEVEDEAIVNASERHQRLDTDRGNITLDTRSLSLTNNAAISASTSGQGDAGDIAVRNAESISLTDRSTISTSVNPEAVGQGGDVILQTETLELGDRATISANTEGRGNAGSITITANELFSATNSDVVTSAANASGGAIRIAAGDIRLYGDSDIRTEVAGGAGGAGNITLSADAIVAFDDSDILAFANRQGGQIVLDTPAFFGENYQPAAADVDPRTLDNNERVDINANAQIPGTVTTPDVSLIQNSLTNLPETAIDSDRLLANSCIARTEQGGTFLVTGGGGLPERPGNASISPYPTGEVRSVPSDASTEEGDRSWQLGDPIVEPQGVYQLPNGQIVMSRDCSEQD